MEARPWHRHYDEGVPASLAYEPLTVPELVARAAERVPGQTALVFQNARFSYRELLFEVRRTAAAFARLGVEPGSCVAIHMPNVPQAVFAYQAALALGARVVLTNPLYTPPELEHQWNDAGCTLVCTMDFLWEQKVRALRPKLPARTYVVASLPEYLRFPQNLLAPFVLRRRDPPMVARVAEEPGVHRFKPLVRAARPEAAPSPRLDLDEVAVLQYTGGTTGVSKAAMLTHRNLSSNVQQLDAWFPAKHFGTGAVLSCLPLFHVFGMTVGMNWVLASGARMVLVPNPRDIVSVADAIQEHRVTIFPGVPALFNALAHLPDIRSRDLSSVFACFSGSAPIPPDVLERFETLTGARILEGFGMTETSPVTHVNPLGGLRKVGTVGIPVPDTDARVVDVDTGTRELGAGEEGELVIRGPQVMKGYWNRPDETAGVLRDGWMYTGDLASMDADGYFRICGRKKDMINVNGLKVYPDEVDHVLTAFPAVLEAATIGVPDAERGELVKSFVVLKPGESAAREALLAHCKESLAPYKVPREIEFLPELPKSTVLKVLRRELRDREIARRAGSS